MNPLQDAETRDGTEEGREVRESDRQQLSQAVETLAIRVADARAFGTKEFEGNDTPRKAKAKFVVAQARDFLECAADLLARKHAARHVATSRAACERTYLKFFFAASAAFGDVAAVSKAIRAAHKASSDPFAQTAAECRAYCVVLLHVTAPDPGKCFAPPKALGAVNRRLQRTVQ